mmetsp:Transcript_25457/g.45174  ORF Transcript_25457/g.45174 Transcript_25457/m.45174 type:complete len:205 (-) Transcript_25457:1280-1894(-)
MFVAEATHGRRPWSHGLRPGLTFRRNAQGTQGHRSWHHGCGPEAAAGRGVDRDSWCCFFADRGLEFFLVAAVHVVVAESFLLRVGVIRLLKCLRISLSMKSNQKQKLFEGQSAVARELAFVHECLYVFQPGREAHASEDVHKINPLDATGALTVESLEDAAELISLCFGKAFFQMAIITEAVKFLKGHRLRAHGLRILKPQVFQ